MGAHSWRAALEDEQRLGTASQEPMHDSTNRACLALNQQMHMVGHETVCVEEER